MGIELNTGMIDPDAEVEKLEPDLPPPGYERTEELKRRADTLAQQAEELGAELERERINPDKLRVDNEIAQHFDENEAWNLTIADAREDMVYKWVYRDPAGRFGGYFVTREKTYGWEVVQGTGPESPEAREYLHVDGTRVVGDTLLMRIRKDKYIVLMRREQRKAKRHSEAVTSHLEELGERARGRGIKVHTDVNAMNPQVAERLFKSAHAEQLVQKTVDKMIREGRMPGVPAPGTRG